MTARPRWRLADNRVDCLPSRLQQIVRQSGFSFANFGSNPASALPGVGSMRLHRMHAVECPGLRLKLRGRRACGFEPSEPTPGRLALVRMTYCPMGTRSGRVHNPERFQRRHGCRVHGRDIRRGHGGKLQQYVLGSVGCPTCTEHRVNPSNLLEAIAFPATPAGLRAG